MMKSYLYKSEKTIIEADAYICNNSLIGSAWMELSERSQYII
jgi:hypothetical protein